MNYKISVIIPFFYRDNKSINKNYYFSLLSFDKCLSAVFKSKYKNFEVIAVSDGSNDHSIEIANKYSCKIIKLKKNSGPAYARNKGASLAKGKILVFVDSDIEIKDDALNIINKYFNLKNNQGIVQGIYSHKPNYENPTTQYLNSYHCYYLFSETKRNKYTQSLCTCFFAIRKDIFARHKGFDSKFSSATVEDVELGFRLIREGYKIPIERKLNTIHHTDLGIFSFIKRIARVHIAEMKMYLRKKYFIKAKQSNYFAVTFGILLISLISTLIFVNLFYSIPYFNKLFILLNILFILLHTNFLVFILFNKGFLSAVRAIIYNYLHRFLVAICIVIGIIDYYLFKNKY